MSTQAKKLPQGWSAILDEVNARLDQAITSANARIEQLSHANPESQVRDRAEDISQWNERLHRITTFLESAEQVVQSVDQMLAEEEASLRQQLNICASLRQKAG